MVAIKPETTVPEFVTDGKYILNGNGDPVPMPHLITWSDWYELAVRRGTLAIGKTQVGEVFVSTVFLGVDFGCGVKLELFETMCRAGGDLGDQFEGGEFFGRYATRAEAVEGHANIVKLVRKAIAR